MTVTDPEIRDELRKRGVWIAELARQHRVLVLSRDEHFDRVGGLRRVDW